MMIPDVSANNREIPAGKVLLAEYRDVNEGFAKREVLDTKFAGFKNKTEYKLVACFAGWAIAGSCLRWDNGSFGVVFEMDNSKHGRHYKTYEEAKTAFDNVKSW